MKKVLFITNIPSPYRIDFFNEFGKYVQLTVLFEAKTAARYGVNFNWNLESIQNFRAIFLKEGDIDESKVDKSIFQYINKGEYDEIIATNYVYRTEMAAIIRMKFKGIPYYLETDGGMPKKENIFKRLLKRFLISGAKGYFSPSEGADDYLAFYGAKRDRIHRYPFTSLYERDILPTPLTAEEKQAAKAAMGIVEKKVILGVGQFIPRKGFDVLMNACKGMDEDTGIYIVGGEPTEEYLKLKTELGLNNLHFVGFCDKRTVGAYYRAADVFVLPTREDIWGLVINEAMAYGLPVVTTEKCVAGVALVENGVNGFIVPVEDEAKTRRAIDEALDGENAQRMGAESLRKIKNYTFENMAKTHVEVLNS